MWSELSLSSRAGRVSNKVNAGGAPLLPRPAQLVLHHAQCLFHGPDPRCVYQGWGPGRAEVTPRARGCSVQAPTLEAVAGRGVQPCWGGSGTGLVAKLNQSVRNAEERSFHSI